jgi:hypothetical protein
LYVGMRDGVIVEIKTGIRGFADFNRDHFIRQIRLFAYSSECCHPNRWKAAT